LAFGGGVGFFFSAAPVGRLVGAPHIVPALEALSLVFFLYGLYTPLVGALNGNKRFVAQAGLDVLAATLRTAGLIAGAYFWARGAGALSGVAGASYGFVASAAAVLGVALFLVGVGRRGRGGPDVGAYLAFIAPLLLGQVLLNLLLQADLTLLRRFAAEAALDAGLPLTAADPLVGAYRATQLYCFLPYQLLLAITFILFPMLAAARRDGDRAAVARYVTTGTRLALLLMGAMVSVTAGLPGPLIALVFGSDAARLGTPAMQLLSLGFGAFALFGIFVTVLNSLKYERASALVTATAFALVVVLCFARVRGQPFGPDLLERTALATSIGLGVATLAAAGIVRRAAGAVVAPLSVVRVLGCMALAIGFARIVPVQGKLATLGASAAVGAVYVALLVLSRELGRDDWALARRILARGR
jgi:stage V sporulation protein B